MRPETFTLRQKELQRIAVISDCVRGRLACARAAELLQLSSRQVKRLKLRLRHGGEAAMAHASRGRPSPRRLPEPVRRQILVLARGSYVGFNDHHLCEKLCEVEGFSLSRETLRRLRRAREGEMLQIDGSPHDWLEGRGPQLTLLGFQDDATGKVVGAEFFPAETAHGYFRVLRSVLRRYGVPLSLYGDRCGVFVRNDHHWTVEEELAGRQQPTQFGRALQQLGVTFLPAQSPQAKGRIERTWGVFQDRLVSELRAAQATDLLTANRILRRFLSDHNRRFGQAPAQADKAWRPAPRELDRICCFIHERVVSNDNVVQWEGRRLQIPPQPHRFSFAGAKVQLYENLAGRVSIYYQDTRLQHAEG
jgi:transposase